MGGNKGRRDNHAALRLIPHDGVIPAKAAALQWEYGVNARASERRPPGASAARSTPQAGEAGAGIPMRSSGLDTVQRNLQQMVRAGRAAWNSHLKTPQLGRERVRRNVPCSVQDAAAMKAGESACSNGGSERRQSTRPWRPSRSGRPCRSHDADVQLRHAETAAAAAAPCQPHSSSSGGAGCRGGGSSLKDVDEVELAHRIISLKNEVVQPRRRSSAGSWGGSCDSLSGESTASSGRSSSDEDGDLSTEEEEEEEEEAESAGPVDAETAEELQDKQRQSASQIGKLKPAAAPAAAITDVECKGSLAGVRPQDMPASPTAKQKQNATPPQRSSQGGTRSSVLPRGLAAECAATPSACCPTDGTDAAAGKEVAAGAKLQQLLDSMPRDVKGRPYPYLQPPLIPGMAATVCFQASPEDRQLQGLQPLMHRKMWVKYTGIENSAVKTAMKQAGFRVTKKGSNWNVLWGSVMHHSKYKDLSRHQRCNHFPATWELGRKDRLYLNLARMKRLRGRAFDIVPKFFLLPGDAEELKAHAQRHPRCLYIRKPVASSRGRGIRMVSKPKGELAHDKKVVVQRYIQDPLTINGFKFDIRVYAAITCLDPLRVYVYEDGLARFATRPYHADKASLRDRCVHLTNYSVNRKDAAFLHTATEQDDGQGSKWSLQALRLHLETRLGISWRIVWQQVHDIVAKAVVAAEPRMNMAQKMLVPHRCTCYEVFGFDIMLDAALRAWLIEVNTSPALGCSGAVDRKVKMPMLASLFHMLGIVPHNPAALKAAKARRKKARLTGLNAGKAGEADAEEAQMGKKRDIKAAWAFAFDGYQPQQLPEAVQETEAELARAGQWQRVFPCLDEPMRYLDLFETARHDNILICRHSAHKQELQQHQQQTRLPGTALTHTATPSDATAAGPGRSFRNRRRISSGSGSESVSRAARVKPSAQPQASEQGSSNAASPSGRIPQPLFGFSASVGPRTRAVHNPATPFRRSRSSPLTPLTHDDSAPAHASANASSRGIAHPSSASFRQNSALPQHASSGSAALATGGADVPPTSLPRRARSVDATPNRSSVPNRHDAPIRSRTGSHRKRTSSVESDTDRPRPSEKVMLMLGRDRTAFMLASDSARATTRKAA